MDMDGMQIPNQGQSQPAGYLPGGGGAPYGWEEPRVELRDYIRMLLKRRQIIALTFIGIVAAAAVYVWSAPRIYRSVAKVRILQPPSPPALDFMLPNAMKTPEISLRTEAKVAQSSLTLEEAARYLLAAIPRGAADGPRAEDNRIRLLDQEPPDLGGDTQQQWLESDERARALRSVTREIQSSLKVVAEEPDVLGILAENTDPERAALIANAVQIAYLQESRRTAQAEVTAQEEFLVKRISEAKSDLEALEMAVRRFKEKHDLRRSDAQAAAEAQAALENASEAERLRADLRFSESELASLRGRLKITKPLRRAMRVVNDPVAENYRKQIAEAEGELLRVQSEHPDNHPLVVSRRGQLDQLLRQYESRFGKRVSSFQLEEIEEPNPVYEALNEQVSALESRVAGMRAKSAAVTAMAKERQASLPAQPLAYVELARLEHEKDLREKIWLSLQEELQRTEVSGARTLGAARPLEIARVDDVPVRPRRKQTLVLAALVGILAGLSLALLLEHTDTSVDDPDELAASTGIPSLGFIPVSRDLGASPLITLRSPRSPLSESFRSIRSNLKFAHLDSPLHTLLVTSSSASEGKTFTSSNLAVVFAQSGLKTILVDCDLRRPTLHRVFGIEHAPGLTNLLADEVSLEQVMHHTDLEALSIIPSGSVPPNPSELLDSHRMQGLIETLKGIADIVIFDTPPALVVTDAIILSARVDSMVVVVEQGRVSTRALLDLRRMVDQARGRLAGAVINKVKAGLGDYYYHYYRDYYAGSNKRVSNGKRRRRVLPEAPEEMAALPGDSGPGSGDA